MKNKGKKRVKEDLYNPRLTDVNRDRERQVIIDPEKGPSNKRRRHK